MELTHLNKWQWFGLGLVFAAIFSVAVAATEQDPGDRVGVITVNQILFEDYVRQIANPGKSTITMSGLVLHPKTQKGELLTGKIVDEHLDVHNLGSKITQQILFKLDLGEPHSHPNVHSKSGRQITPPLLVNFDDKNPLPLRDYLQKLHEAEPKVSFPFRYAWWETRIHVATMHINGTAKEIWISLLVMLWFFATLFTFSVIFPLISNIVVYGSIFRPLAMEEGKPDRPYRKAPEQKKTVRAGMSAADLAQLEALEAEMEKKLGRTGPRTPAAPQAATPATPVKPLLGGSAVETAAKPLPVADDTPKEFKGEFYPVARPIVEKQKKSKK